MYDLNNSLVFSPDETRVFRLYVKLQQLSSIVNTNNIIVLIKNLNIYRGITDNNVISSVENKINPIQHSKPGVPSAVTNVL